VTADDDRPGPLWSELPAARRDFELAKLGIEIDELVRDGFDVPKLAPALERLDLEAQRYAVLVYFGDERNPQPPERTRWELWGRTPDWGRLPRLDDAERPEARRLRPGRKFASVPEADVQQAARIYANSNGKLEPYGLWTLNIAEDSRRRGSGERQNERSLSRAMIRHLVVAIDNGWLPWDDVQNELRISDEFRTSPGMMIIPRGKPAS